MPAPHFIHLRLHSEYSVVDGIVRIDDAVSRAKTDRMPALALTDLSNLFGAIKFYSAARAQGLKPIIGCDVWITNPQNREQSHRLLLLCKSSLGYRHLCELLTRAFRTNQHRGRAEIRQEWFEEFGDGLIALSGALHGDIGKALAQDNLRAAALCLARWQSLFPQAFYIELQRTGQLQEQGYVRRALALASDAGAPVVATHPIQFLDVDSFRAHEARVCVAEGYVLGDPRRRREFSKEQYFKSQAEMTALFADIPTALTNTIEIAKRCNAELELGKIRLPDYPTPEGMGRNEYLTEQSRSRLITRMAQLYPDMGTRAQRTPEYGARLDFELMTIIQMGFAGYFLIVADFINWAKNNGVPVGPGRGSGAGSLVAYCLGITDLDPLRYGLLFERFLNPERVSMPDFDIDFCQDGRDRVIDYVRRKYGDESVSQIATFGTMAAKAAVRDVGRVLDLGYNFCDGIAKLIPFQPGKLITLKVARQMEPMLAEREKKEEEVAELLELAERVEGLTRNVGMHAGGVLIAPGKLTDFCPLYCGEGGDTVISQFDKDDVEAIGLIKFDFLGLTTLTILDWAVKYVKGEGDGPLFDAEFDLNAIPLDDAPSYQLLSTANTSAVFQLESRGMRDMLLKAKPDRFEDIIALVALYRPGPMDLIPDFCERKHGRQRIDYPDPRVERILAETYGIMVYQEQVMQMAQIIGGYSLGSADLLRRAMGKKKPEEMATHRVIFREGANKNGLSNLKADELFDLMEKFAGYGFNKSHAAAYALLAYQTAYLKVHHPAAFMAANLSAAMDDTDKVHALFEDAAANKLEVMPPDINSGGYRFVPVSKTAIRYGLGAIKGTGESAILAIVKERQEHGLYRDLVDFCNRVDKRIVNRRAMESLIRGGAFDSVNDHRAQLFASLGMALEQAQLASRNERQSSLFNDGAGAALQVLQYAKVPRWSEGELLQHEKAAIGFYLSGHPFDPYRKELLGLVRCSLADLKPRSEPVLVAGVVYGMRNQQTRRGRMAAVTLDDGSGKIEVAIFNEVWERHRHLVKEDQLLFVEGRVSEDAFSGGMRVTADRVFDLAGARNEFAREIKLSFNGQADAARLAQMIKPHMPGTCAVRIAYRNRDALCEMEIGSAKISDALLSSLTQWLTAEQVEVHY
ncbi:MAG: DNA polymerase III subunit alpha [Burkholderiales bacterium]